MSTVAKNALPIAFLPIPKGIEYDHRTETWWHKKNHTFVYPERDNNTNELAWYETPVQIYPEVRSWYHTQFPLDQYERLPKPPQIK